MEWTLPKVTPRVAGRAGTVAMDGFWVQVQKPNLNLLEQQPAQLGYPELI